MNGRFGAHFLDDGRTRFRLWAPEARTVDVVSAGEVAAMRRDEAGMFETVLHASPGDLYRYRIDGDMEVPDPASRLQNGDLHDESVVVDARYAWCHEHFAGRPWHETVVYEVHAGAYGGFAGVKADLSRLQALGVTAVQLMPIADFPGRHNWGYDGVLTYAPDTAYGTPDDLRELIDAAHGLGLMVFLDVVYNHFGPDGNYLNLYAKSFFREDKHTPWGNAIDFRKEQVRRFFIENAIYWVTDYRFDGLRFDAVHAIEDEAFLLELAAEVRAAAPGRHVHLILENENNDSALLRAAAGDQKFDAQWTDDWHHCAHVLLTGETEGYYGDFESPAAQMARCMAEGFAYQGEPSAHADGAPRGSPSAHLPPLAFVICLQNHDQIGNRAMGERLAALAHPKALRAAAALLLLTPQIPMIFMGEDWGSQKPFLYFTDHNEELGALVREGRRKEFAHFEAFTHAETREKIPDPNASATFEASRALPPALPDAEEQGWIDLYKQCLALRAAQIVPFMAWCVALGAVAIGDKAVRAEWRLDDGAVLTLAANLGPDAVACAAGAGAIIYGADGFVDGVLKGYATCAWIAR
jgi:maltooligosyltrehalose trehalohydrolase